jgi:hypothetical protein
MGDDSPGIPEHRYHFLAYDVFCLRIPDIGGRPMKEGCMRIIALFAISTIYCLQGASQSLPVPKAKAYQGEIAKVCGVVAHEHTDASRRGIPTSINLDFADPSQVSTILIWGEDRDLVGELPKHGSYVCVQGEINDHTVVVRHKQQFSQ